MPARPQVPSSWRWSAAALGSFLLLFSLPLAWSTLGSMVLRLGGGILFYFLPALAGGVLVVGLMRNGGRDVFFAVVGVAVALLTALLAEAPFLFFVGLGFGGGLALLLSRGLRVVAALGAAGVVAILVSMALLLQRRGPPSPELDALDALRISGGVALGLALLIHAMVSRSQPRRGLSRRAAVGILGTGAALLALSFLTGGHLLFLPLWPFALALIVLPALGRWRAAPMGATLLVIVALAGALPVGTCTADLWSDAVVPGEDPAADARPERVMLAELAGNGPGWASGGGFSGVRVHCTAGLLAAGAAWGLVLVGVAAWVVSRPGSDSGIIYQ